MKSASPIPFPHSQMRTVNCTSHGVPLRLRIGGDELFACLPDLLPFATELNSAPVAEAETFTLLPPEGEHQYVCYTGAKLTRGSAVPGPVLEQFARDMMIHVANFCPDRVFVHAGVVGWKDRGIVLPGPSFAGKTTLIAALVRAGATYYSDEYAVVDQSGWVYPYARDLQMRQPGGSEQRSLPVGCLGGHAAITPLRVAQVAFTYYQPGARWSPQPVTSGMAVLEMMRHTIPVQRDPRRVMSTLTAMVEGATAWSSARGEADAAVRSLLQSLENLPEPGIRPVEQDGALA